MERSFITHRVHEVGRDMRHGATPRSTRDGQQAERGGEAVGKSLYRVFFRKE